MWQEGSMILGFYWKYQSKECDCFQKSMTFLKFFITLATSVKIQFIKPY